VTQSRLVRQIRTGHHVPDILDCLAQSLVLFCAAL
jgi:hypothetical protein